MINNSIWDYISKVAGVTFDNRQSILKSLYENDKWRMFWLIYTQFSGEFAIKVMDMNTRQIIGWIPKNELQKIWQTGLYILTGQIGLCMDTYFAKLYVPIPPSHEQFLKVIEICKAKQWLIPIYDIRPYTVLLDQTLQF